MLLFLLRRTTGEIELENSKTISFSSRAFKASERKRELRLTLPSFSTVVSILESFSPSSLATDLIEKISGFLASQTMAPLTLLAKRAASLVTRINSSRDNSSLILLSST